MKSGEYVHPIDIAAGVEPYQRLSDGVSEALAEASRSVSYAKSAQKVAQGQISPQSVMRKIRECSVPDRPETKDKPKPATLHIDADEDHITLRGGKKAIVPLVSAYEGIEKRGNRGICRNVFHIARYGEKTEELWEEVLTEMEKRYDLSETKLYLHGDGANWIRAGLKFLPNCVFVLDPYHRKKALRQAVGGLEEKKAEECRKALYEALKNGEKERFASLAETLREAQAAKSAKEALKYLRNQFDAIHIRFVDPETRNGGATEPHISHVLSSRLSSRPMAWSEETLRHFVPVLASGRFLLKKRRTILLKALRNLPNVRRKRRPLLFLSACPTRTGRSLFLPVPAKLLLFLMPCVLSDTFSQNPYNKVIPTFLQLFLDIAGRALI